mmetsp:Transcript_1300/g.2215  ORF Transcript_1300/g.2215 Transcript_1300/m.2215 type:complete len:216 (+) Transcript_1300:1567-2214(+)
MTGAVSGLGQATGMTRAVSGLGQAIPGALESSRLGLSSCRPNEPPAVSGVQGFHQLLTCLKRRMLTMHPGLHRKVSSQRKPWKCLRYPWTVPGSSSAKCRSVRAGGQEEVQAQPHHRSARLHRRHGALPQLRRKSSIRPKCRSSRTPFGKTWRQLCRPNKTPLLASQGTPARQKLLGLQGSLRLACSQLEVLPVPLVAGGRLECAESVWAVTTYM